MTLWWASCVLVLCLTSEMTAQACVAEIANGAVECYAGSVRCNEGYLYTKEDPTFHCGQMEQGECRPYIWSGQQANDNRNMDTGFSPPRVPTSGWSVCVTAVPTQFTKIAIDFLGNEDRTVVSHFDIRMSGNHGSMFDESVVINEAEMDEYGEYQWGHQETYHPQPYPFAVGDEFTVKIVASDEHTLTYYANSRQVATREIQRSVRDLTKVVVTGDVDVSQVNLWCR